MQKQVRIFIVLLISLVTIQCGSGPTKDSKVVNRETSASHDSTSYATGKAADSVNQTGPVIAAVDSTQTNAESDWLLIPGIAAGNTKINTDAAQVFARLGKPDQQDAAMMKAVAIWYTNHDTNAHSIGIYTSMGTDSGAVAAIKQIRITSPSFETKDGIHVSSSLSIIKQSFKQLNQVETYTYAGKLYKVYDSPEGIAFEMAPGGTCVAIIIHEKGKNKYGTYLKFRPGN
jgi:hypothetical protein